MMIMKQHSKSLVLSGSLCLLIPILSHQTGSPAVNCLQHDSFPGEPRCVFLLLRTGQVEFFRSKLSLT